MTERPLRFRSKNARPVHHSWCPAWARSFTGRRTEAVSCQLERDHDGDHRAELDRKYTTVTVTWAADSRPTHRIQPKELA